MTTQDCCSDFALSRRGLLKTAIVAGGMTTAFGETVVTASPARSLTPATSVLVVLSLRGGADGLSLVVPHGDPAYYAARPRLAVPADALLAKDAMFGLHPSLAPLLPLWQAGSLAAVHAAGLPAPNRSHFSAMEEVEDAAPGSAVRSGWLNRLLGTRSTGSPLQGIGVGGGVMPASLYGPLPLMTAASVDDVAISGDDQWDTDPAGKRRRSLHTLWDSNSTDLGTAMRATMSATRHFEPVLETPASKGYPDSDLGRALAQVARIVRGDVGVEVVTVDQGDWDMHTGLGTLEWGRMKDNAGALAAAVAALFADLGPLAAKVTLVTLSEFGRRVKENDNYGLDHGYGNVMLLAGAGVAGGQYHGTWPGLTDADDADLLVTTDYRSVLAEVVSRRFGSSLSTVFPGFTPTPVGVMKRA